MPATALTYPKRRRRKTLAGVKASVKPWLDPSCNFWYDPTDLSTMTLWPVHAFGNSDKSYISTPATPDLDATTELTIEMWVSLKTLTSDRAFASKSIYASDVCGWGIGGGGNTNEFNTVQFWCRGEGGAFVARSTATYNLAVGKQLSHFVITFNAGTVKIWRNGVAETLSGAGTVPTKIGANLTALQIGNWSVYAGTSNFGCGVFRYWTRDIGDTLAATLHNSGTPILHNQLTDSLRGNRLVCSIDGDSKTCKATGRVFTDTLAVDAEKVCTQCRDKSRNGRHLSAPFGRGYWLSTINSKNALRGYLQQSMLVSTANAVNSPTGSIFSVEQVDTFAGAENFFLCSEDDDGNSTLKYGMTGWEARTTSDAKSPSVAADGNYPFLRVRNASSPNGNVRVGGGAYVVGAAYVINWNGTGSGGAASYTYWGNGVNYSLSINSIAQNAWLDQLGVTDALYVGGALGGVAIGGGSWYAGRRGIVAGFNLAMSSEMRPFIQKLIADSYEISV